LAEPREEEDYEEESITGYTTICLTCGELFTSSISLATQCRSCYLNELSSNETAQEKEQPAFEPRTRGGYEYVIYKIYSEESGVLPYLIHGAVKNDEGKWKYSSWRLDGGFSDLKSVDATDLIPLKKRRFKTADELVANQYGVTEFHCYGRITVRHDMMVYTRNRSDTPEGNYSKEWLDVFTTTEEEI
jgi:hypothetical protein